MNVFKLRNAVLAAAIAGSLVACGGGGGIGGIFGGRVADGYVSGATVKFDINDSGVCGDVASENAPGNVVATDSQGNFTYPSNISATHIVCASGGTDISTNKPFVGELKAPVGATQVTPLTTLVQATIAANPLLTPAAAANQVAANLGLPASTKLLSDDPVALAASNPKLAQTTTAVQALLVQAANSVAAAATGTAPTGAQTTALFNSAVAGLAAAITVPVDLTDNTIAGTAKVTTLITTAISNTVTNVKNDATAAATVVGVANLAPASVAAVAAAQVTKVTQDVATTDAQILVAPPVAGVSASLAAQTDTTATATTVLMAKMLTTAVATAAPGAVTSAALVASALTTATAIANGDAAGAAAAAQTLVTAVNTAAPTLVIPAVTAPTLLTLTNVLVLSAPKVNNVAVSTATTPYSVTVTGPLTNAAMNVSVSGTPTLPATSSAGFDVTEVGGSRVLKLVIDNVNVTNNAGVISVTVPATAKLYAYGKNTAGTVYQAVLTNAASNVFTSAAGVVTVNWSNALTALSGQAGFSSLSLIKGTFDVTTALSGTPLAKLTSIAGAVPVTADAASVAIPVSTTIPAGASAAGQGVTVRVIVQ